MSARTRRSCPVGLRHVLNETGDRPRDQFERDGVQVTVDYKPNGDIRKAWVTERMGERVIDGTSKARKVISYLRTGFIGAAVEQRGAAWRLRTSRNGFWGFGLLTKRVLELSRSCRLLACAEGPHAATEDGCHRFLLYLSCKTRRFGQIGLDAVVSGRPSIVSPNPCPPAKRTSPQLKSVCEDRSIRYHGSSLGNRSIV
jgi:hypothetical protein